MKKILSAIALLAATFIGRAQVDAVYGPWIQNVTEDSFTVLFKTDCKSLARVEVTADDGKTWYQSAHQPYYDTVSGRRLTSDFHAIKVTGLKPATTYCYRAIAKRIADDSNPYGVKYGAEETLCEVKKIRTLDYNAPTCRFSMVNDMHNDVKKYSTLMSGMDKAKTDFVVLCGDIISYAPGADSVMKYTFGPIDDIAASFPVIYARGNHEGRGPEWYDIPKLFPSPTGEFYFSFRQGPVAFLVLDLGEDKPDSDPEYSGQAAYDQFRAEELEWIRKAVKEPAFASAPHKVVLVHIPTFDAPSAWYSQHWGAVNLNPVLNEAGVELMLSGHHHKYIKADPGEYGNDFTIIANDNKSRLDFEADKDKMTVRIYGVDGALTKTLNF